MGLFLDVMVLLVGPEEGLLLELRVPGTGRLFQALLLLQHPLLAGGRLHIYRRLVGPILAWRMAWW